MMRDKVSIQMDAVFHVFMIDLLQRLQVKVDMRH